MSISNQRNAHMQCRFTMRNHYTPTSMAKIKMTDIIKCWRIVEQLELSHIAVRNAKRNSHFRKVWQFLIKLNIFFSYNPAIPLPSMYPEETKTYVLTKAILVSL